jgi:hypothetical protein
MPGIATEIIVLRTMLGEKYCDHSFTDEENKPQ